MAVFESREQLSDRIKELIGDRTDDVALNFIKDTLDTYDSRSSSDDMITKEEHDRLMNEQDTSWRTRYRDTFFGSPDPNFASNGADKSKSDPAASVPGSSENNPADFKDLFG